MNPWTKLDGYKTTIGTVCLLTGTVLSQVVSGVWHYNPWWMPQTIETLSWVGIVFGGTGLGHKAIKANKKKLKRLR